MIRSLHPFAARMAPDLAISSMKTLAEGSVVLDPMAGSGTVLRHAGEMGLKALGFDVDPLAVLMARVWTTPVDEDLVATLANDVMQELPKCESTHLPWIDSDDETRRFVEFWFGDSQRQDLRRLAHVLDGLRKRYNDNECIAAIDVLCLALSRIIITKDKGASLGRDISHSRPHKVSSTSCFDVNAAFARSVKQLIRRLTTSPPPCNVHITLGDARQLLSVESCTIDAVITSPPYLNAIDYMRGHRLSLVWLGYNVAQLRSIRAFSIGAERRPESAPDLGFMGPILHAMVPRHNLRPRHQSMLIRYAQDLHLLTSEVARVLKPEGRAVLVMGNSCLKGTFVSNSSGAKVAARLAGLRVIEEKERELPARNRYLPMPATPLAPLGRRMKTETILTLEKVV